MYEFSQNYLETPGLLMIRNVIQTNLGNGSPTLVVLGEKGAGKSALLRKMAHDFQNRFDCKLYRAHRRTSPTSSLHATIERQWATKNQGCKTDNMLFQALRDANPKHPPLLIIDDAELLLDTELHSVLQLKKALDVAGKTRLGLILSGYPTLGQRIEELTPESSSHRMSLRLRPLSRSETEVLITRLGYNLSKRQLAGIHRNTKGIPGQIIGELAQNHRKYAKGFALHKWLLPIGPIAILLTSTTAFLLHFHST